MANMNRILSVLSCITVSVALFAQPKEIKVSVDGIDIELVRIEPGVVTLPSRPAFTKEKWGVITLPESTEAITEPYYIMKYPLTRGQWARIEMGEGKYMQTGKKATMPMTLAYSDDNGVDHNLDRHVIPFINKIRQKTGLDWELPSLGEWLYACGPIPEDFENYAWIDGSAHQVGLKKPNANGAYDMLGMLAEMVARSSYEQDGKLAEDCPGILKVQIVKEGNKFGLETEYGMVLKPEYDAIKMAEVDSELSAGANIPFLEYASYAYNYRQEAQRLASQKGEFEKTADFEARKANPALQKAYVDPLMKDFEKSFIATITKDRRTGIALLDYDADKEVYRFKVNNARTLWTVYELPVPIDAAPAFKEYIRTAPQQELLQSARWGIVEDCAQILSITFTLPDGGSFTYSNPAWEQ